MKAWPKVKLRDVLTHEGEVMRLLGEIEALVGEVEG